MFDQAPGITGDPNDEVLVTRGSLETVLNALDGQTSQLDLNEAVTHLWSMLYDQDGDAVEYELELEDGVL